RSLARWHKAPRAGLLDAEASDGDLFSPPSGDQDRRGVADDLSGWCDPSGKAVEPAPWPDRVRHQIHRPFSMSRGTEGVFVSTCLGLLSTICTILLDICL